MVLNESAILAGNTRGNLYDKLSPSEKEQMSLDYDDWIKLMKRDCISLKYCEQDAKAHYKKMVGKRARELNKILYQQLDTGGQTLTLIPANETLQEFKKEDKKNNNELSSKKNFDMIRKRTEIRQKLAQEAEMKRRELLMQKKVNQKVKGGNLSFLF